MNPELESLFWGEGDALEEQEDYFMPKYIVGHSVFVTSND